MALSIAGLQDVCYSLYPPTGQLGEISKETEKGKIKIKLK
jgi:hypothetical protein